MAEINSTPQYHELLNPTLQALRDLGGSGTIDEIYQKVSEITNLPEGILEIPHNPEKSSISEVEYRLAWARTYLKKYGLIENSVRGVWTLIPEKKDIEIVDPKKVVKTVKSKLKEKIKDNNSPTGVNKEIEEEVEEKQKWKDELYNILTKQIKPDAFERLVKRLLRESGFVQVEVTGRSGDGGIDGKGIIKVGGLLSFHVVFQCKKYQGTVSPSQVRDFRGAMIGRADKGLLITTGTFTRDAIKEATRDGAPPIDLIDGEQLADKLKEFGMGIESKLVEEIKVSKEWYMQI